VIGHDGHEYLFEGFSLLSHYPLGNLPVCKVIRFNIEYTIVYIEEDLPYNFTMRELDLFCKLIIDTNFQRFKLKTCFFADQYLFVEILELVDFNLKAANDPEGCPRFHFFPRFVRELPGLKLNSVYGATIYLHFVAENGISILSMSEIMKYLLEQNIPLVNQEDLLEYLNKAQTDWLNIADEVKGK